MKRLEKVDRVLTTLRRIIRELDSHSRQISQHHGMTVPQLVLLQEIAAQGTVSVGDLAREVSLSQATVTSILDRLAARDLIVRRRGETDKRVVRVELTASGQSVLQTAPPLLQERFVAAFGRLRDWEQSQILSSLERVADMMGLSTASSAAPILTAEPIPAPREDESSAAQSAELQRDIHS